MAIESHLAFGDEPEPPRRRDGFEARKNKKELGERELAHTVIWERSESDSNPSTLAQPKTAAKTEAEPTKPVRQNPESGAKPAVAVERHIERSKDPDPAQLKIDHKTDGRPAPTRKSTETLAAKVSHPEQQPVDARSERSNTGEQLQHIAEQTAERAAELANRHRSPEGSRAEVVPETTEKLTPENHPKESVSERQMRTPELFKLSQSIRVEGVSVAEMFAARRIDEDGLRRIVTEFLRGRNVEKIITEEVVRLQLKFELDPQLRRKRNLVGSVAAGKAAGHIKAQTKKLADPKRAKRRAARLSAFARSSLREAREIIDENPQVAKIVGGIAIVLIYATILVLLITR